MRLGLGHGIDVGYRSELFGVTSYLLDTYTGAAAAYSLRKLSASTINVVRIRRSSDDAEADFTATEVSDGTLTTWVGAGNDGFVTTWYDQSGNGNDATQATAANQPLIVSGGELVLDNGLPAIDFDGSDDYLDIPSNLIINNHSIFATITQNNLAGAIIAVSNSGGYYLRYTSNDPTSLIWYIPDTTNNVLAFSGVVSTQQLITAIKSSTDVYTYTDGSNENTRASIGDLASYPTAIGRYAGSFYYGSYMQEIILFDSDQSANRTAIETNINDYYSIY